MANFWLNTQKTSVIGRNRRSITIPAFAVRCGEENRSLFFKLRTSSGAISNAVSGIDYGLVSAFTVEMWLYTWGTFSAGAILFANHRNIENNTNIQILMQDEKIGVAVLKGASTSSFISASKYPTNRWFHLAVTYDGTTFKIFIDGVQDTNTMTLAASLDSGTGNSYTYLLGNNISSGSPFPFVGYMGEVRIWKAALSASQIKRNRFYRRGKNTNLIQYYKTNLNGSGEGNFPELITGTNITISLFGSTTLFERISSSYPPLKYGASFIAAKIAVTVSSPITFNYPVKAPSGVNFMLCVSYVGDDGRMVRYKLWDMDGVSFFPIPERYRGQNLPTSFFFEVWNIDGQSNCTLASDLVVLISKTDIPSNQIDQSNQDEAGALTVDYSIFEILTTTFPADFADNGFGTVANPVTQPAGTYSTNLTTWGGI